MRLSLIVAVVLTTRCVSYDPPFELGGGAKSSFRTVFIEVEGDQVTRREVGESLTAHLRAAQPNVIVVDHPALADVIATSDDV